MRKFITFLFLFTISVQGFCQDFSNKGKDFWLCFPQHVPNQSANLATLSIFITSDKASSGTITMPNGAFSSTFNIVANALQEIQIPWNANIHISNGESSDGIVNTILKKAIHIKVDAGKPAVVAYAQQWAGARSAATLLLPVNVLGKKYYSISFAQNGSNFGSYISRSQFQVIAVKDNTVINITPVKNGVVGTPFTVILPLAGDMIQYQSSDGNASSQDLTGTLIESVASGSGGCLPIAVFSGSSNTAFGLNTPNCIGSSYDPLWQQLYPVSTWGKNFGFVPFQDYPSGNPYRVLASENNTNVYFNGSLVATLNAGEIYPSNFTAFPIVLTAPTSITADKPISVTQYSQSQGCAGNGNTIGDPDMVILNPIEQNINDITIFSSNRQAITKQWINVLMKTNATPSFTINGVVPATAWQTFAPLPGYSYLRHLLPGTGSYRLTADSGFNAIAYGFGSFESYAYSAGTNVKDLYQQIGVSTQYGIEQTPSVCSGSPFKFKVSLPYQPDSIYWDLSNLPGTPVNVMVRYPPSVADSSTIVNGKTIYWYSLPNIYTFPTAGVFPVTITTFSAGVSACGSEQDIDFELQVSDPPVAGFSWTTPGCPAETVQFTDITTTVKPTYKWWWDFGDPSSGAAANTSSLKNPTHIFSAPGTYTVRYSNITTPGCLSDTIIHQVIVPAFPFATISGTTSVCLNTTNPVITFTAINGVAPYAFTYNINGGPNQTINTVSGNSVTISVPTNIVGVYSYNLVSVVSITAPLCTQSQTGTAVVTVNAFPTATISGSTSICSNAPSPNITFTGGGATGPYRFTYNINGGPSLNVSTTVGNSVTVPVPTNTAGTFIYNLLSVQYVGGVACSQIQTGSAVVVINPLPTASINGSTALCLNTPSPNITFSGAAGTTPYTFTYNINGGPNQTVTTIAGNTAAVVVPTNIAGTFTYNLVSVRDASSSLCSQAQSGNAVVIIHPLPTPNFSISIPSCETRLATFTDNSIPNAGAITNWSWNFGDPASGTNNTSVLQNPTHTFSAAGNYTVSLVVTTTNGCSNILFTKIVTINARPVAGYIIPEVCLSDTYAQFTDTSKVANGTITGWQWNFGDPAATVTNPNTSTLQNPTHSYTAVGLYNVQLISTTNNGCKDTITHALVINGSFPVANFTVNNPTTLCANDSVAIVNTSTVFPGSITKVEIYWDNVNFPAVFQIDDDPFSGKVYKHKYPNFQSPLTRIFTIRYRAYSGGVCVNDRISNITVNAAPKVQFNAMPDACFDAVPFQVTQATETGAVPGTFVFTGPGVSASGLFNPVLAGIGTHTIKYTFTSAAGGCVDSMSRTIKVLDTATAKFTFTGPACDGNAATFKEASTAPAGVTLNNTIWNFGDGSPLENHAPGTTFTHLFPAWGAYTVTMYNTSAYGCRSTSIVQSVYINPIPQTSFSFVESSICLPAASVSFVNNSTIADGTENAFTYAWNFGDPASGSLNTSLAKTPAPHIYRGTGPYTVTLTVTSGSSCKNTFTRVIDFIHPQPKAAFTSSKPGVCIGDDVTFNDITNGLDGTVQQWNWNFGDGVTGNTKQVQHLYATAKTFDVSLFIKNSQGCNSDTIIKQFTVHPYPVVDAGPGRVVLQGGAITIQPQVTGNDLQYLWSPATYLNSTTSATPKASNVQADIRYTLTVTARGGCKSSDTMSVKVLLAPRIPNTFTPNGDGINEVWAIDYLDTYPNNRVQVFNRTGQLVFESRGYKKPWDGTMNGKPLPLDTYYYIIEPESGRKPVTGYVTIVK